MKACNSLQRPKTSMLLTCCPSPSFICRPMGELWRLCLTAWIQVKCKEICGNNRRYMKILVIEDCTAGVSVSRAKGKVFVDFEGAEVLLFLLSFLSSAVHGRTQPYGHSKAATPARPAEKSSDLSTLLSTRSTRSTGSTRSTRRHSQILRLFSDSCEEASVTLQHEKV